MVLQTDKSAGSTTALHRQGPLPSPAAVPRGSALGETLGGGETAPVSASRLVPKMLVSACQVPRQESMVSGLTTPPQYEGANADWGAGAVLSLSRGQRGPARASEGQESAPQFDAPRPAQPRLRRDPWVDGGQARAWTENGQVKTGETKKHTPKTAMQPCIFCALRCQTGPLLGPVHAVHAIHRPLAPRSGPYVS